MKTLFSLIIITCLLYACGNDNNNDEESNSPALREGIKVIDGVERSELALTMRLMYDQMKLVSDSIDNGHEVSINYLNRYKSIHTDVATEPEKIDEIYSGLADNFIKQYAAFETATGNKKAAFNNMLDACLACHVSKCPGPIKAIKKIKLRDN